MGAASSDIWSVIGPYALAGLAFVVVAAYTDIKRDNRWVKKNVIKILIELGIKADD